MASENKRPRPVVLAILDGFGIAPDETGNAVTRAKMPFLQMLTQRYPVVSLKATGETVGLLWGQMGNSEVGHITIGAGRVHYQALPHIEQTIEDGSFFTDPELEKVFEHLKASGGKLHLLGILSNGKVHGYNRHIYALLDAAKRHKFKNVFIHVILDGRDALYNSGLEFVNELQAKIVELKVGKIASVSGRYYAMDRDNHWERTELAYRAIVDGQGVMTDDIEEKIKESYAANVFDEEFVPVVCVERGAPVATVENGDAILVTNFRPDRARQITKAFCLPVFQPFTRRNIDNLLVATMTEYEKELPVLVIHKDPDIPNTLAEVISNAGLVQLHIAETEKYAHVTFFLNGKKEEPWPHEDRILVPSLRIPSYAAQPEMATEQITVKILEALKTNNYDVIIVNFASPDMVAHTGDLPATIKANEIVDNSLRQITDAVLAMEGAVLITADHGNAEEVTNLQTGEMDKEHSTNPVPLFIVAKNLEGRAGLSGDVPNGDLSLLTPIGTLADVAPTMLKILGIMPPPEMTGTPLIDDSF